MISPNGIILIKSCEQFKAKRYFCSAGKPTIGYGHVILKSEPFLWDTIIDEEEAHSILAADIGLFEAELTPLLSKVSLNQNQYDAIVCLVFNIGVANFTSSTLLRLLKTGAYEQASLEFLKWDKITNPKTGQKEVCDGLLNRRKKEQTLFLT